ncbi:uncharacterized protein [Haliotis asinina]|uniref:uncharacterized protein n=1 Tax=Haliotis asinina TaxID=109174 RepID=UPI0035324009
MKYYVPGSLRQTRCSETFTTMAMCFHVATWYTLSNVLVTLTVASPVLQLSGEPDTVADGDALLLSCNRNTPETPPLFAVIWSRNTEEIFQTLEAGGLSNISNTSEYNEVAGRLNVTTNKQSHKIMLQINSSLDDGSVWRCHIGNYYSNSFTVEVLIPTTVATTAEGHIPTTVTHYGPSSAEKSPSDVPKVYVIAGSCAGLVIVIVTVIVIAVCMKHIAGPREMTITSSKSDPSHPVWVPETGGSDVNNEYASSEMITGASASDDTSEYVNPKVLTETAESDIHDGYTSTSVITKSSSSDTSHEYASSEVTLDVTNGSEMYSRIVTPSMIAETIVSDEHYEYTTGGAHYNQDGQYSDICTHDRQPYTDTGKEDNPYLQPIPGDLQTNTAEYITAMFVSTNENPSHEDTA